MKKKKILYLGNALQQHGFTISTMEVHSKLLEKHFEVYSASSKKHRLLRMLDFIRTFLKHRKQVDGVIISTFSTLNFYYAWVIALLARFYHVPYIPYLHGGGLPNRLKHSPRMSRAIFKYAYTNVAPSGYLEQAFQNAGFQVTHIPNFIQTPTHFSRLRAHCEAKLLWVRSFEQIYHPEMTIRVFQQIAQLYPYAQLCMVGPDKDGSLARCQALVTQAGLTDQVQFTGKLSKTEWMALADHYDVFISTTRFDNTPVSVLEAMSLGLPVVSTDVGGVSFLIKHGQEGLLSPSEDITAMVNNLKRLLDSPELAQRLSKNGMAKAQTHQWPVVEQQWLTLLNNLP